MYIPPHPPPLFPEEMVSEGTDKQTDRERQKQALTQTKPDQDLHQARRRGEIPQRSQKIHRAPQRGDE